MTVSERVARTTRHTTGQTVESTTTTPHGAEIRHQSGSASATRNYPAVWHRVNVVAAIHTVCRRHDTQSTDAATRGVSTHHSAARLL